MATSMAQTSHTPGRPLKLYRFTSQLQDLEMAFMDVRPARGKSNGKVAVLLHGKNFCGATWEETTRQLTAVGYRVILPDQVGFCKSSKPVHYQFSLQQLSANTRALLSALGLADTPVTVIGHSLGGMTAVRYGLMYPGTISSIVLVNPIGLEDWKALGVPARTVDELHVSEMASNYTTIRAYEQQTYYLGEWNDSYDVWARMLANIYAGSQGGAGRVRHGPPHRHGHHPARRVRVWPAAAAHAAAHRREGRHGPRQAVEPARRPGHYDVLGEQAAAAMPNAELIEFPDLGHSPQIQAPERFHDALLTWLSNL